jgi:hypothetical protein
MATIKLQPSGAVVIKDGKVSCECCEDICFGIRLETRPSDPLFLKKLSGDDPDVPAFTNISVSFSVTDEDGASYSGGYSGLWVTCETAKVQEIIPIPDPEEYPCGIFRGGGTDGVIESEISYENGIFYFLLEDYFSFSLVYLLTPPGCPVETFNTCTIIINGESYAGYSFFPQFSNGIYTITLS